MVQSNNIQTRTHCCSTKPLRFDVSPVVGPDGFIMTGARKRFHNLCNSLFVWAIFCLVSCGLCILSAVLTMNHIDAIQIIALGSDFNGIPTEYIMWIEAGFCLLSALIAGTESIIGVRWLYEQRFNLLTALLLGLICSCSIAYEILALAIVHVFDPISFFNLVWVLAFVSTMYHVVKERPELVAYPMDDTCVEPQEASQDTKVKAE